MDKRSTSGIVCECSRQPSAAIGGQDSFAVPQPSDGIANERCTVKPFMGMNIGARGSLPAKIGIGEQRNNIWIPGSESAISSVDVHGPTIRVSRWASEKPLQKVDQRSKQLSINTEKMGKKERLCIRN